MRTLLVPLLLTLVCHVGESGQIVAQVGEQQSFYVVAGYDETADPFADLELTRERAQREGKRILLQVGGEWCVWCHILDRFIQEHAAISERLQSGYLIMKVTWTFQNQNRRFLSQYPEIPGYPHLYVLDSDGTFLHSQPTLELESGRSYNERRILEFLEAWSPDEANAQVGCFDVSLGDWAPVESTYVVDSPRPPRPDESRDSVVYSIPPRLRLQGERVRGSARRFLVTVPENSLQVPHSFLSWRGTSDSLRIVLSTGFAGTTSTLHPTSDGWSGTSRTFSDVVGLLRYERPITLRRVDCDSEPPVPASADKRLPRSVELRDHSPLVLGQSVPAGALAHPQRSGAKTLEVKPSGMWAVADTVLVRVDDQDVVFHIEMRYSGGFDLSPLVQELAGEFGAGDDLRGTNSFFWHNRTTTMFIDTGRSRPRVVIFDPRFN